jgi:hypothetical protein
MTTETSAADVVARLEEAAFAEMQANGRYDLMDALHEGGYDLQKVADGLLRFMVAGIDYILAIVKNFSPSGLNSVFWVEDPANTCVASTRVTNLFAIPRSSWVLATVPAP